MTSPTPALGDVRYGREIGKSLKSNRYQYVACVECGAKRWVPTFHIPQLCFPCSRLRNLKATKQAYACRECGKAMRGRIRPRCRDCFRSANAPLIRAVARIEFSPDGCWLWRDWIDRGGYGKFPMGKTSVIAHRWLYQAIVGPVPQCLQLDHLCRVRHCVNPDHLEPVTRLENIRRGIRSRAALANGSS